MAVPRSTSRRQLSFLLLSAFLALLAPTTLAFNFFPTRSSGAALKAGGPVAKVMLCLL